MSDFEETRRKRVSPTLEREKLLRNPATGWMLYDDAAGEVADAESYWDAMDEAARKHASIFYLRWRWSDAEPEEGRYAWKYDDNFKALIEGARKRGLRLAFRFYVASKDNLRQSTPDFVRVAGAEGAMQDGEGGVPLWSPYIDDPIFQEKLGNFVAAFAEEYDDPSRVDFIDALGLGWWGEGHNLNLKDPNSWESVYYWILDLYSDHFRKVLLGIQYNTAFGWEFDEDLAIRGRDYIIRRDGLGSFWFSDHERERFEELFPRHPLFGERCYWGDRPEMPELAARDDARFGDRIHSWRDLDEVAIEDALTHHANTLDLRTVVDTQRFMGYPELIERFKREGGYRLALKEASFSKCLGIGQSTTIEHTWINLGTGVLPNHNQRWAQKYRPAFALIAEGSEAPDESMIWIDSTAEPGDWTADHEYPYSLEITVPETIRPGRYRLACAILNTLGDGMPSLEIAITNDRVEEWYFLGSIEVEGS